MKLGNLGVKSYIVVLVTLHLCNLSFAVFPICTQVDSQGAPAISSDIVVWVDDRRDGNNHIYGYDLSTSTEFPISTDISFQSNPDISGNIVVWTDYRNGNNDIYGYDLSTSTEFPICTDIGQQDAPAISGSIVVWRDSRNYNFTEFDIYGYNLSTSTEFPVCTAVKNQSPPAISGDVVVWQDYRNNNGNIYGYNLNTSTEFPICTDLSIQSRPAISGNIVVWEDSRNGGTNIDIYGYDLSTSTEFPVCTNTNLQFYPAISDNIVVWMDYRNTGINFEDIYGYDLNTSTEFPICIGIESQLVPAVSPIAIVWLDYRNGNGDIYGTLTSGPITSLPEQIANILDFIDASVANGSLTGKGPGKSGKNRLKTFTKMVENVQKHIDSDNYKSAGNKLDVVLKRCNGKSSGFIGGEAVEELVEMLLQLKASLENGDCEYITVINEAHVFNDPFPFTLDERSIDITSIVITDVTGLLIYTEGDDYIITQIGDQVEITLTTLGIDFPNISDGQTLLVDYEYVNCD